MVTETWTSLLAAKLIYIVYTRSLPVSQVITNPLQMTTSRALLACPEHTPLSPVKQPAMPALLERFKIKWDNPSAASANQDTSQARAKSHASL